MEYDDGMVSLGMDGGGVVLVNYAWGILRLGSATVISSRRLIAINCDIYVWMRETLSTGKRWGKETL